LRSELVSLNSQISRERQRPESDQTRLADLKTRLQKARLQYEAFQTGLYAAHPELRLQRGEAKALTLSEAAALLPDAQSALLQYVVTSDRTYLFVLSKGKAFDQGGVDLKAHVLEIKEKELSDLATTFREQLAKRDSTFRLAAIKLYDTLLTPAQVELQRKQTLIIVPDGALWELPFQALQDSSGRYLIEQYAISYAPSLTVLDGMSKLRRRNSATAAASGLLAIGNPILEKQAFETLKMVHRDEKLSSLPEAEREVKALAQLYGAAQSKVYIGAEAREERFKAEAGRFIILHLATHGILNDPSPMYSQVVLAPSEKGGVEDGLLEAWEIMKLNLNADLAVLSSCESGRGRVGAGEGIIGLSWALFVAGVPTTVVSQWKVESASTTALMLEFHRNLRSGVKYPRMRVSTAKALQQASLKLLRQSEYRHPFYWAGFVVVGDGN
jgi:CHAT domain-containing protein